MPSLSPHRGGDLSGDARRALRCDPLGRTAAVLPEGGAFTERITAALADRAAHGVRVRILLDAFGPHKADRRQLATLRRAGCQIALYRPLRTWRITVLNQRSAVLVRGPAVAGLRGAFAVDCAQIRFPLFDLDLRSLALNEQVGVLADDPGLTRRLR